MPVGKSKTLQEANHQVHITTTEDSRMYLPLELCGPPGESLVSLGAIPILQIYYLSQKATGRGKGRLVFRGETERKLLKY